MLLYVIYIYVSICNIYVIYMYAIIYNIFDGRTQEAGRCVTLRALRSQDRCGGANNLPIYTQHLCDVYIYIVFVYM